jgi:hypothetical protein
MKFLSFLFTFLAASVCLSAQTCVVSVSESDVHVGVNQPSEIRSRNTLELNRMFAKINSGAIPCHNVAFPEGTVEINGAVSVFQGASNPGPVPTAGGAFGAITVYGVNRETSIIMQTAPGQPAFRWDSNDLYVSSIYVHDLGFDNSNVSAPYAPGQWGLEFQCTPGGTGGNSWGYANSQFERLNINHMYVGLGVYTASGGVCGMWSTHFQDLKFYNSQRNAMYLAGGNIGTPANVLDRIDVLQQNGAPPNVASGGDQVDAAAVMAIGSHGMLINSLDIEGWNSPSSEIEIYGGNATVINNLRVEHAAYTGCNPTIGFFDGDVVLNGTNISWDSFSNSCTAYVFSLGSQTSTVMVNGVTLGSTVGAPSQPLSLWRVDNPNPPAKIFARGLTLNGLASEWMPSTSVLNGTLYSRRLIEDMPPPVDVLPTASATYLGRSFQLVTSEGCTVYQCTLKSGVYQWVAK